jgi:hypothetical protein
MKVVWSRAPVLALAGALACGTQSSKVGNNPTNNDNTDAVMAKADTASTEIFANPVNNITCKPGFNKFLGPPPAGALPFTPVTSLKTVANPVLSFNAKTGAPVVRGDLTSYLADAQAAIQLGKAFFWEMQAGSDNKVSCATCHFQGGRTRAARTSSTRPTAALTCPPRTRRSRRELPVRRSGAWA